MFILYTGGSSCRVFHSAFPVLFFGVSLKTTSLENSYHLLTTCYVPGPLGAGSALSQGTRSVHVGGGHPGSLPVHEATGRGRHVASSNALSSAPVGSPRRPSRGAGSLSPNPLGCFSPFLLPQSRERPDVGSFQLVPRISQALGGAQPSCPQSLQAHRSRSARRAPLAAHTPRAHGDGPDAPPGLAARRAGPGHICGGRRLRARSPGHCPADAGSPGCFRAPPPARLRTAAASFSARRPRSARSEQGTASCYRQNVNFLPLSSSISPEVPRKRVGGPPSPGRHTPRCGGRDIAGLRVPCPPAARPFHGRSEHNTPCRNSKTKRISIRFLTLKIGSQHADGLHARLGVRENIFLNNQLPAGLEHRDSLLGRGGNSVPHLGLGQSQETRKPRK